MENSIILLFLGATQFLMIVKHNTISENTETESQRSLLDLLPHIGILKTNWFNSKGKLRAYNYGTAFMLTPRVLLTCSHNVYSELMGRDCQSLEFAPGHKEGEVRRGFYQSKKKLIIKK